MLRTVANVVNRADVIDEDTNPLLHSGAFSEPAVEPRLKLVSKATFTVYFGHWSTTCS
jgi:hypothetical protein